MIEICVNNNKKTKIRNRFLSRSNNTPSIMSMRVYRIYTIVQIIIFNYLSVIVFIYTNDGVKLTLYNYAFNGI